MNKVWGQEPAKSGGGFSLRLDGEMTAGVELPGAAQFCLRTYLLANDAHTGIFLKIIEFGQRGRQILVGGSAVPFVNLPASNAKKAAPQCVGGCNR